MSYWKGLGVKLGIAGVIGVICVSPIAFYLYNKYFKRRSAIQDEYTNTSDISSTINESVSVNLPPLSGSKVSKVLSKICDNVLNNLALAYDIIKEDFNKIENSGNLELDKLKLSCNLFL